MSSNTYPSTTRAKVVRYNQRAAYDYSTIHSIISSAQIVHVTFTPSPTDPFPTTLPMIGALGTYSPTDPTPSDPSTSPQDIYLHGYVSSRLARLTSAAHTLDEETGLPVCVAATCIDGLVLSLTPFSHSMNYRSVVVHGYAAPVTDPAEKLWAMQLVTEGVLKGRWEGSRTPPTNAEITGTTILKVSVVSASAKVRAEGANSDKKDAEDADLTKRVWQGVVPSWVQYGKPEPSAACEVEVPKYLSEAVDGWNRNGEERAVNAAKGV